MSETFRGLITRTSAAIERFRGGGPWDEGEEYAVVYRDAVVVFAMDEGRTLNIKAILGEPIKIDEPCGLLEEVAP